MAQQKSEGTDPYKEAAEQANAQAQEQAQKAADSDAKSTKGADQVTNLTRNRWAKGDLIVPAKGTVTLTKRQKENSQLMRRVARAMEIGVLKRG